MSDEVFKHKYRDEIIEQVDDFGDTFWKPKGDYPFKHKRTYDIPNNCVYIFTDEIIEGLELVAEDVPWE